MNVYEYLLSYNVKPSVQRIAIMDYLLKHKTHPSIDDIYLALSKSIPTLSKTTVYNTLKLLTENGAAQMLTIDERNACFDGDITPHAHFQCKACGKIFDVFDMPENQSTESLKSEGFCIDETQVYYIGLCPSCAKKKLKNEKEQ